MRRKPWLRADALLRRLRVREIPVPVGEIAKRLEVPVVFEHGLQEISGMVCREQGSTFIVVNADHGTNRQRFTIAHELGHIVLEHPLQGQVHVDRAIRLRDTSTSRPKDSAEIEANLFAAALLMPADSIMKAVRAMGGRPTEFEIGELAAQFGVSELAMDIRLKTLLRTRETT